MLRLFVIIIMSWGLFCAKSAAQENSKIKIGISIPLSGEAATYGADLKSAYLFANEKFGNNRYELLFEDDKCSGKDAATVAHKFADIDHVRFVLGYGCSGALLSAAPILENAKIVTIGAGTSSPDITNAGYYIFRTCPSDIAAGKVLGMYLQTYQQSLAAINEETNYAQDIADEILKVYGNKNSVTRATFVPNSGDFKPILLNLKSRKPNGLLVITQSEGSLALIVKQLAELNWKPTIYTAYYPASPTFISATGALSDGIVFVDLPIRERLLTPDGRTVYEEFLRTYPLKSIEFYSISAIAGFLALNQAVERSGPAATNDDIKNLLYSATFENILTPYSFDKNGDITGSMSHVIRIIKNEKPYE